MLSIAVTVGLVSPFAVAQRRIRGAFRFLLHLLRFGFGLLAAVILFALIITLFTSLCPAGSTHAPLFNAAGIFLATMLCVPAATIPEAERQALRVLPWISAAAILLPAGLFSRAYATGAWQSCFMLYLAATFCGGIVGTRMTLRFITSRPRVLCLG